MQESTATAITPEQQLWEDIGSYAEDPLGYVLYAFPWGEPGTPLEKRSLEDWQREEAEQLGEEIRKRKFDGTNAVDPVLAAIASGHGVGKSAWTGMLVCFLLDTRPRSKGTITANTGNQLQTKTIPEVAKWRKMSITADYWEVSTGGGYIRHIHIPESWRADFLTWKKENPEAFAGQHASDSSPWMIFDEASSIVRAIFETARGGMTDGEPFWFLFGNPTRNDGEFYDCFHKNRARWRTRQIDSRNVSFTNKKLIDEWIEDFGEDSDFVRIRVKGVFPRAGSKQFIPHDSVERARHCDLITPEWTDPLLIGVDVARYGSNESVIAIRRARDARSFKWGIHRELSTMQLAARVVELIKEMNQLGLSVAPPFIDAGGNGGGVIDRLEMLGYDCIGVDFGGTPTDKKKYRNKVAEMWGRMKAWINDGGCLPDDEILAEQLTHRDYFYTDKQQIFLEKKEDLERRGVESPDRPDALCLTFAEFVAPREPGYESENNEALGGYNPYDEED